MKIFVTLVVALMMVAALFGAAENPRHRGYITGAYPEYKDTVTVTITPGYGFCNGKYWRLDQGTDLSLSSVLPTGEDYVYIYIDESSITDYQTFSFYGSTTEPTYQTAVPDEKFGWYNGYDRCIGVVYTPTGSATIQSYTTTRGVVRWKYGSGGLGIQLANNISGTASWTAPGTESSAKLPVNADGAILWIHSLDTNDKCIVYAIAYERSVNGPHVYAADIVGSGYGGANGTGIVDLGSSRNIRLASDSNDDSIYCWLNGFRISR